MAALFWHGEGRTLSEATTNIGELKRVIEHSLGQKGFANVRINNLEVAGSKNESWLSIAHFHIADRRFWEVVMCSGATSDKAKATVDEVVAMLRGLRFL
ncbi:MAG TPA: hypothetical protein VH643_06085 [Gemmataceae bacterium]|jgi:hypothetical protein